MSIHAGQAPAVETSDGTAPVQKENENTVTTVEFRASYALGGLCTPPPPHFDAVFPQELQHRVSEQEFQAQFDAFNALLAHAHTEIRRTRFVPLGIVLLGVVMCVLAVVVAVSASNKHERGPIWPVAVGVPLLAVGLAGVYVTRRRRSILVDQCVEALDARVGVLNSTTYQRAGLEWRATVVSACVEVAGRTRMVRLPVIELDINMSLHYAMQYVDYVPRPTPSGSVFDSDGDFLPVGSSMLQPAAPALLAPDVSGSGSDTDMA